MVGVKGNVIHIMRRYVYIKGLGLKLPEEENLLLSLDCPSRSFSSKGVVQDGYLNVCRGNYSVQ